MMEERVGFEPTELLHPSVFKTDAISRTLPPLPLKSMEERAGIEPARGWCPVRISNPLPYRSATAPLFGPIEPPTIGVGVPLDASFLWLVAEGPQVGSLTVFPPEKAGVHQPVYTTPLGGF